MLPQVNDMGVSSGIARGGGGVVEGLWLCGFVGVVKTDGCRVRVG